MSGTPIPRAWAFDLKGQEMISFVFTLQVNCGLFFSEIVGKFEGEVGGSYRAK